MAQDRAARILHDVGLGIWFGGSLMGAVGLNGAANDVLDRTDRAKAASAGWARWAPVNAAAIGSHLLGGAMIVRANQPRIRKQSGVVQWTMAKSVLTGTALVATAYSGVLGRQVASAGLVDADGGAKPSAETPAETAQAMNRLRVLQWALPAMTSGIVAASAVMGEQQRPAEVARGTARRARHS